MALGCERGSSDLETARSAHAAAGQLSMVMDDNRLLYRGDAVGHRTIGARDLYPIFREATEISAVIMTVLALAGVFAYAVNTLGVADPLVAWVRGLGLGLIVATTMVVQSQTPAVVVKRFAISSGIEIQETGNVDASRRENQSRLPVARWPVVR